MLTKENEQTKRRFIREYEKKAVPLNWAWRKVEELQGYEGDRTERDYGDPTGEGSVEYQNK